MISYVEGLVGDGSGNVVRGEQLGWIVQQGSW